MKLTDYNKLGQPAQNTQSDQTGKTKYDWLPAVGGIAGMGIMSGQFAKEGEMFNQILSGQNPMTPQNAEKQTGAGLEQSLYSLIPGGSEAGGIVGNLTKPIIGRAAERLAGGAAVGAGTQAVRNVTSGQPVTKDLGAQGVATGALNTIIPGISKALNIPSRTIQGLGSTALNSANRILENKGTPMLDAISHLFGTTSIGQQGGKSFIAPEVSAFIKEHNIPIPPNENWLGIKPAVQEAQKSIEAKLQPLLTPISTSIEGLKTSILDFNKNKFAPGDRGFQKTLPDSVQKLMSTNATNVDLYTLKQAQRDLGQVANWKDPQHTPLDKFAMQTYNDIGNLIESQLTRPENAMAKALNDQHKIAINLKSNIKDLEKQKILPEYIKSASRAAAKSQTGLSQERLAGLAIHSIPFVAAAGAQVIPGVPPELKALAGLGAGAYGLAEFGPHLNPELGAKIGQTMKNTPQVGAGVEKLLQQLGVRLPSLGQ